MFPNSMLGIAAGICGTIFIGYCIYFDRKRRLDPNFKKILRERRKAQREAAQAKKSSIPPLKDNEAIQSYFFHEVQLGEELLAQGDVSSAVEHLANAVAVCSQQTQLLNVLGTTLPPQVYQMLIEKLNISERHKVAFGPRILTLAEEDVE